ncbi:hypothetical protein A3H89_00520 [Candidatus Amesbacteria bacterium RIFCSPLOWO2_02_FULL_48_11]|uniref:Uncharacterized protein n=4 Tax=Candidatus Amesiibacteriota TaxID=1752730 RepID=A0A1F4Z5U1_9BACT|nr:MAG: hypothetical protein UX78_C0011G0010 [Candidatus Amesbacteria bacterium GW2011_GWA2_47_11]KKU99148.1 MAG: hypothetical protein UY33_C0036G0008 [Candidatus Amesbacteria bacterium GW2011_GWA1_48_9]OGC89115.1 MAG: hypothetical protein A2V48_01660 [Candidatus Amesbacteria bacterium RBG_19FT_COMBO_48_16]OGC98617.1 MAG: hypothetical protein A2W16_03195 [Candidatus Amesbacteria bacterium RBG_16_48_31]OGD01184.1 MAG: hypothetical protein A2354_00115 [Candidatus Amesbacteria bacterium RIFOXYB1_F
MVKKEFSFQEGQADDYQILIKLAGQLIQARYPLKLTEVAPPGQAEPSLTVKTRDPKIFSAFTIAIKAMQANRKLLETQMTAQAVGQKIWMSNGQNRWPRERITLEEIERNNQALANLAIRDKLGSGPLSVLSSIVRGLFNR